jgi:hypothetical protein
MRKYFAKKLVERRRGGNYTTKVKGANRDLQREPLEERATHESMRAAYKGDRKESHEHLAPLRRYLQSQVGRLWDHVYSDLSHAARQDSINGRKLMDSLRWEVDQTVQLVDGKLIGRWGYTVGGGELFVHPENGLLTRAESRPRRRWRPRAQFDAVVVDVSHRYLKLDGIWFFVTLTPIPGPEESERPYDLVLKRSAFPEHRQLTHSNEFSRVWGGALYASAKRQANKREIQRLQAGPQESAADKPGRRPQFVRPRRR